MASDKVNLERLLEELELSDYYPEKLTRDELYQLTIDILKTEKKEDVPLVWQFIQDITRYNYNARNVENKYVPCHDPSLSGVRKARAKPHTESRIHPLDIIVCVFLCCEPTARQDFVLHMWTCRLAIPFILQPNQTGQVTVYLWPLRSLIGQILKTNEFVDRPLIHEAMDCIGFIRAGENESWSKSYLLDCLIWGPDKTHPTFLHRDSEGSKRTRSCAVEGLVEIGWYLPSGEKDDRFSCPKVLLNLRGDSKNHPDQIKIIGQLSSMTLLLTTMKELISSASIVKSLLEQNSRVIILISDKRLENDRLTKMVEETFSEIPMKELELIELEQKRLPVILKCIYFNMKEMEENGKSKLVLSDVVKNISFMTAFVDETSTVYKEVFELAKDITSTVRDSQKQSIFPLQESYWKEWAQTSRDFRRYHQLDDIKRKALKAESREQLEFHMYNLRLKQYEHILQNGIAKPVELFIKAMSNFVSNYEHAKRRIFLRLMKTELDNMSIEKLVPINREYQELVNKATDAQANEKAEINSKISHLDDRKYGLLFGLEHILRELGQIYEACQSQLQGQERLSANDNNRFVLDQYKNLPKYMCFCLKDGYPFELLDGEARSVPPLWTKAVFSELESVLQEVSASRKECTIHVLSVLGIQSSGKSTIINVMFGLQFAVSSGRCTRGAFMQLVKVHDSLSHFLGDSVDYIAVIDTEGLRSPGLSSFESIKHDNELSTLVIGLAHTTVINLMGENATYLEENLPIVVQAFLRMYLVRLHPRCTIVHQNVDKRNREKMLQQGLILQTVLNQLTCEACEIEKVPQKTFKDIIAFDVVEHTKYIPSLLDGVLPMAPISASYSMEATATRKLLIEFLKKDCVTNVHDRYSISSFCNHLFHLWDAILTDNFLYEYRSTTEFAIRLDIDRNYLQIILELIEDFDESVSEKLKKMEFTKLDPECAINELERYLKKKLKAHQVKFENVIDSRKSTTPYFLEEWRKTYLDDLQMTFSSLLEEAKTQLQEYHENIRQKLTKKEIKNFYQRCQEVSFEAAFSELKAEKSLVSSKYNYQSDAIEALKNVCLPLRHLLKLDSFDENARISNFKISDERHINHSFKNFTEKEVCELRKLMNELKETVKQEYESEILTIRRKRNIHSYSCRIPKQIMLRVEKTLSARLQSDDLLKGISNQFKIDLLSCVAMTCVCDMKDLYNADVELRVLKMNLRGKVLSTSKLEHSISKAIFEVVETGLKHNFSEQVVVYMLDASHKSIYKAFIGSKSQMIGHCITFFINDCRDDIMLEYINDPKHALKHYLKILMETYISECFLECDLQFYIRRAIDQVWNAFETTDINVSNLSKRSVLEAVLQKTDLPVTIKDIARIKFKAIFIKDETVNFKLLRENMLHYVEGYIQTMQSDLIPLVRSKKEEYALVLADTLTERLVGCLHQCQIYKEICLLSEGHASSHIFLHRLNYGGNDYFHRPEDIQTVWKWLSCNKREIVRRENLQMVEEVPDEWKLITKPEVIADIENSLLRF